MSEEVEDIGLFGAAVHEDRLHPSFKALRDDAEREPARRMMEEVFERMGDRDGNFREQFQTTGFDSRVWELYLYAALSDAGYKVDLPDPAPDFMLSAEEERWTLEATTANLRSGEASPQVGSDEELLDFLKHELPIRLGSPLFTKLRKNYIDGNGEMARLPFALGLECFVNTDSMFHTESPLGGYLYGIHSTPYRNPDGSFGVRHEKIAEHRFGEKRIPSGFFKQPGAEQISAVLFSNSGTSAKFTRMGYQRGIGAERLWVGRYGYRADPSPDASGPLFFAEEVGERVEHWSEGLVVFHNPWATHPLPDRRLSEVAVNYTLIDGRIRHTAIPSHVFTSQTLIVPAPKGKSVKLARAEGRRRLRAIAKELGVEAVGRVDAGPGGS
jgi:hypothetical protein